MKHDKVEKKQKKSKNIFLLVTSRYSGEDSVERCSSLEECKEKAIELVDENGVDAEDLKIYKISKTWSLKQSNINFVEEK
jgi:hypothetical protein